MGLAGVDWGSPLASGRVGGKGSGASVHVLALPPAGFVTLAERPYPCEPQFPYLESEDDDIRLKVWLGELVTRGHMCKALSTGPGTQRWAPRTWHPIGTSCCCFRSCWVLREVSQAVATQARASEGGRVRGEPCRTCERRQGFGARLRSLPACRVWGALGSCPPGQADDLGGGVREHGHQQSLVDTDAPASCISAVWGLPAAVHLGGRALEAPARLRPPSALPAPLWTAAWTAGESRGGGQPTLRTAPRLYCVGGIASLAFCQRGKMATYCEFRALCLVPFGL